MKITLLFLLSLFSLIIVAQDFPFQDDKLDEQIRAKDLTLRLTIEEKINLLSYDTKGVPRLGVPKYNWWNEALHGVGRAGRATVFPQAIGMSATFNAPLIQEVANAISDEARAKYNAAVRNKNYTQYMGLSFWSPNINIFRDPRWGRGHETWGEDPYLTGEMGAAFVNGMQGTNPHYLKTLACAKHFAVHSGPEPLRHGFNAEVSKSDLYNTYLPAFEKLVTKAHVQSVMCAYNAVDGKPCCINTFLVDTVLRQQWKFDGYLVTDCWALSDIVDGHKYVTTNEAVAALAIKAGVNVECGSSMASLHKALQDKLITEKEIDKALLMNIVSLIRLGLLDVNNNNPYNAIKENVVASEAHKALARKTAAESMVLLTNKNNVLPLSTNIKTLCVTGPTANDNDVMLANYSGFSGNIVTHLEGIINAVGVGSQVQYEKGCNLSDSTQPRSPWIAGFAETIIAVVGLSPVLEGENGDAAMSKAGGDKVDIKFPSNQIAFLRSIKKAHPNKPLIALVTTGSAIELNEVAEIADAVLITWYGGEQGGNAAADILFGKVNPSGRLPVTFYDSNNDLPPFENYDMKNRTYRYITKQPKFNFGFGLSYANIKITSVTASNKSSFKEPNKLIITGKLINNSKTDGATVVQLYVKKKNATASDAVMELKSFTKVMTKKGAITNFNMKLDVAELGIYDEQQNKKVFLPLSEYEFMVTLDGKSFSKFNFNN